MTLYYVPVENRRTHEWEIVAVETTGPITAMRRARNARRGSWIKVWAAVRERPSVESMIALRASFDACGYGIGGPRAAAQHAARAAKKMAA